MSERASRSSHATAWTLAILLVPLLYLLSCPLLLKWCCDIHVSPSGIIEFGDHSPSPPRWLVIYSTPTTWLVSQTPLQNPMRAYSLWVFSW